MTEPTDPKKGVDQPSSQDPKVPGIFKPAEEKHGGKQNPSTRVDGIRHPQKVDIEVIKSKERLLMKIYMLLEEAQLLQRNASDRFPKNTFEDIISELGVFKKLLDDGEQPQDIEKDISEIADALKKLQTDLINSVAESEVAAKNKENETNRLVLLITAQSNYQAIKYELQDEIAQLRVSSEDTLAKDLLTTFDGLSWLLDLEKLEAFVKTNEIPQIHNIYDVLEELSEKIPEIVDTLNKKKQRGHEQREKLLEEGHKQSKVFLKLEEEVLTLKVVDTELLKKYHATKRNVATTETTFYNSPSDSSLTKFDDALLAYGEVVTEMKDHVVQTVEDPTTVPLTPAPEGKPSDEPIVTKVSEVEQKRAPGDINLKEISLYRNAKSDEDKYKIKINGIWETVPRIHWGTLNRYKEVFDNEKYSEKDFSHASTLKDAVLEAIRTGNFEEADKNARALGAELDIIEREESESITSDAQEENEDPDTYRRKGFWNTRVSTISLDGTGNWRIKKGSLFEKMNQEELAKWLPINSALQEYSAFINSPDQAHDFHFVVKLKNEILDALEVHNFVVAKEFVEKLMKQLDPMLDKDTVPDTEKTAARINYEDQQKNLKRLQDPLRVILHDDTTRFAFIKTPLEVTQREYRIINKSTGDLVPLTKKDLSSVELAHSVLTNFKNRASTTQECIEKKNKVLTYINNYDFEKAKIAAQEYLAEFSDIIKQNPLRPTISGSKPSPALEKSNLTRGLVLEKEKLLITEEKLKERFPFLPSPLEKAAFKRLFDELKKLELSISENLTRESLETFTAKNNYLISELAKKEDFLTKQFAKIGVIPTVQLDKNTTVLRSKRLRGSAAALETLQERNERLHRGQETKDITQSREINNKAELLEKHNNMFNRNPSLYKEIYANQNKVRDQVTEDLSTITLANTPVPSEDERRSNFIKNLVARTPEEHLEDLVAQKESIVGRKRNLVEMIMRNDAPENHKEMMETVENEIRSITNEIQRYTDAILSKFTTTKTKPTNDSLLSRKQAYSPAQDESLNDMTRGLGRNYILDENNEPVKIDRAALTKEHIEDIFANEINQNDETEIRQQKEKTNLSGSLYPNHTEGMVSSLNNHEASLVNNTYKVNTLDSAQALYNKDLQAMEDTRAEQDSLSEQPDRTPSENQGKEKLFRGGKLFDSLVKKLNPTTTKQWLMLGLTTIGLAAGSAATIGKIEKNNLEDRRLLDEIKKQPGWKNFLGEKVPEQFIKDFTGPHKLSYEELITKTAPSFGINQNNPSTKDKLSNLFCKNIYFIPGADAGISTQQQMECSTIVSNLKEIMLAAKASVGILYPEKDIENDAIFKDMTLQQFYETVTKAVTEAENERARLQAIKR